MSTGDWRMGHRPALDGIRGIAILLVLVAHVGGVVTDRFLKLGTLGVGLFFVLSGFLITSLLLEEVERTGRVSLRAFYIRRGARLLPALFVVLLLFSAVGVVTAADLLAALLYVSNWYQATFLVTGGLPHLWSLAIEEQFYLVWPLLLLVAWQWWGRRGVAAVAIVGAATSITLRAVLMDGSVESTFQVSRWTFSDCDGLLLGCALAALMSWQPKRISRPGAALTLAAVLTWVALVIPNPFVMVATVASIGGMALVYLAVRGNDAQSAGVLGWRPLVLLGERSYALYLWHVPLMNYLQWKGVPPEVVATIGFPATWLAAALSWRYVEVPARTWARRRLAAKSHDRASTRTDAMQPAVEPEH